MLPIARSHKTVQPTASRPHVGLTCWRAFGAKMNPQPLREMRNTNRAARCERGTHERRAGCRACPQPPAHIDTQHMERGWKKVGGSCGDWRLCYPKWTHVFFFFPWCTAWSDSHDGKTWNVPVQNTRGRFPALFIFVLLPEGEGIVRLSSKTSCSGPQLFSWQQNKGCRKFYKCYISSRTPRLSGINQLRRRQENKNKDKDDFMCSFRVDSDIFFLLFHLLQWRHSSLANRSPGSWSCSDVKYVWTAHSKWILIKINK